MRYELTFTISAIVLFIALNAESLYFIIKLLSYDEIVRYLSNGGIESSDPHGFVYALLITTLFDMLFVFALLCSWFYNKQIIKARKTLKETSNNLITIKT